MNGIKVGCIVGRKSYNSDIFFKVTAINDNVATLKGISYRIEADADVDDLIPMNKERVDRYYNDTILTADREIQCLLRNEETRHFKKNYNLRGQAPENMMPVKILHIDGDRDYLNLCMDEYRKLNIKAYGECIPEKYQPYEVYRLLKKYNPGILVLTGHDAIYKCYEKNPDSIDCYRNSKHFIAAVKEARKYERNIDNLVIFAGACQSMYSGIIKAGANFASSPARILIHALDPVMVCYSIANYMAGEYIEAKDVISNTITGKKGIGGITTKGQYRKIYPMEL